jgi:hypothetical protein
MAELISIAGILALAYMGKRMSQQPKEEYTTTLNPIIEDNSEQSFSRIHNTYTGIDKPVKTEMNNTFADITPNRYPGGLPSYLSEVSNPYRSGNMQNVSPIEKMMVGPGLNVDSSVPAYGGYQQMFRVRPPNVGAYKLTTLPGRSGPAVDVSGGKQAQISTLQHKIAPKTAFLPSRRPPVPGRAHEVTAPEKHGSYEKTMRPTIRSENTTRTDGLQYGPAKRIVSALQSASDPSRNKGDINTYNGRTSGPSPGIADFRGGYTNSPTDLRLAVNRGNQDRAANAGRMNVSMGTPGNLTAVRIDNTDTQGRVNPANGGAYQNYVKPLLQDGINTLKGFENPRATSQSLSVAQRVLANNPLTN